MTRPADYHMHTPLCRHAEGWPVEYAAAARKCGLDEIGISEHAPSQNLNDDWRMTTGDIPEYLERVAAAMEDAARQGGPVVRLGMECDWWPSDRSWLEQLTESAPWDYLIGSVHYISDGWDVDNPKWVGRINETGIRETWELYWKACREAVASGLFDILGHADLVKKFGHRPDGDLCRYYDPVIEALLDTDTALEINTAGWRKVCDEQYPASLFLERAAVAGVPLVISSDAHAPSEVGSDFDRAIVLARNCGFQETCRFTRRQRTTVPLPKVGGGTDLATAAHA